MKILGLDVGERRIGVAKVDSETRIAVPVGFVLNDETVWQEIARIARLQSTNFFVLGLPRSNEGNETKQTLYVRQFAKTLTEKIPGAKVRFQDESLTSVEAEERLKSRKKKYEKGEIDAEAAAIILQDFIESYRGPEPKNQDASTAETTSKTKELKTAIAKEGDKIALKSKKAKRKLRKWTIFGIPVVIILILAGVVAGFKIRDYIRAERQRYYAEQEAKMKAVVFDFQIKPGETIYDVKKNILAINRNENNDNPEYILENYTEAEVEKAFNATYDYEFLQGRPAGATLEGYLYPEKHEFYATSTVEEILTKFLDGMAKAIQDNDLTNRYLAQGLSLNEGITLASVVQKEAPTAEMPTVAQVFLTRLEYGMLLGSDVTVTYALDTVDPGRNIYTDNQVALKIDSCYNTRLYAGLPCGPIANPGLSALLAVAEPSPTNYLYFLTGDDGLMYYSYNEAEHNYKIVTYCRKLCNVSL